MKYECRDGLKKDRYKTANKNVNRLTCFSNMSTILPYDGNKK